MLSLWQGIFLGAVQGLSELFPISSLGHAVIIPAILGWNINEQDPHFLIFLVATHLATAIVLFCFFWNDWMRIIAGIFRSLREREIKENDADAKLGWLLIVSTIPAGLLGLLFEDQIRAIFISALSASFFLTLNGILLFFGEWLRKRAQHSNTSSNAHITRLSYKQGLVVGTLQSLALIPGFSRTGASLSGGLMVGLSHEDALRFSFLLATPIIGAAAVLKIPELFVSADPQFITTTIAGALFAAGFAFISAKFLTRYFKLEKNSLFPFALYCFIAGILACLYIA